MARLRLRPLVLVLLASATIAAALLAAGIGSKKLFERSGTTMPPRPLRVSRALLPQTDAGRFRVTGLQGSVECVQDGRTYVLQPGDLLSLQDVIRTPANARVLLRRGGSEIEVRENLEVRVEALAAQAARFAVLSGEGNMAATVEGDEETVAIAADSTLAVNEGASRWVVARGESGQVAVAVASGQVQFAAAGRTVEVTSGTESVAAPGQAPSAPTPFTDDLLLSVIWPEAPVTEVAQIQGTARPSSRVTINGHPVQVSADGTFSAEIPLQVGDNPVDVQARDLEGRAKQLQRSVKRLPKPPALEAAKENLWSP